MKSLKKTTKKKPLPCLKKKKKFKKRKGKKKELGKPRTGQGKGLANSCKRYGL